MATATVEHPVDELRRSLAIDAIAQISDITRTVRRLMDDSGDEDAAAIQAMMARVEQLSDSVVFVLDKGWKQNPGEIYRMVKGRDMPSTETGGEASHG